MAEMTLEEIEEEKRREALARRLQAEMAAYFRDLENALTRIAAIPDPDAVAREIAARTPRLTGSLSQGIERGLRQGIFQMADQIGDGAIIDPRNQAVRRSIQAATQIENTTQKQVARWRRRAIAGDDKAGSIKNLFRIYKRSRSDLIARHETHLGYEEGRQLSAYSLSSRGQVMQKAWFDQGDDSVTPECRHNSSAGWISYGAAFPEGKQHPPQHYNCRCWLRYRELQPGDMTPSQLRQMRERNARIARLGLDEGAGPLTGLDFRTIALRDRRTR